MDRTTFESIVEIFAMRGGAVDESGPCRRQRAPMADRRAGAIIVATCQRACDVVLIARRHAQSDHVDQQILAFARGR